MCLITSKGREGSSGQSYQCLLGEKECVAGLALESETEIFIPTAQCQFH